MVNGENSIGGLTRDKALLLCVLVLCLNLSACQLQQNQTLEPTVRIPPKVEPVAKPEPVKPANPLVGIWKSNTEMTLASLNATEGISEDSQEYLKQNVFGLLTREFTDSEIRTYFGNVKEGAPESTFQPYRILQESDNAIAIEHTDPLTNKVMQSTFYLAGDCYYELVSKWQYQEYFCRTDVEDKKKFIAVPKANQDQLKRQ